MTKKHKIKIPAQIWILGFVSLFSDISSEMVYGLLPIYLTTVLGLSTSQLGLMEGLAEALSLMVKVFSGAISDAFRNRKWLTTLGYGLAALSKPFIPMANSFSMIFAARMVDRVAKGIRGAPRDALIAFHSPPEIRGASFGLRQSMDNVGAVMGPLIAVGLMMFLHFEIRTVMWISVIPIWFAVLLLIFAVREPEKNQPKLEKKFYFSEVKKLSQSFWIFQILIFILMSAKFSDVFLILKAKEMGWAMAMVPMVMVLMNVVYAVFAYPLGSLSDRVGRHRLIMCGIFLFIVADVNLAFAQNLSWFLVGISIWGLHLAFTQGLFSAVVIDLVPANLRGTSLGIFQFVSGAALLCSSSAAGYLWEKSGSQSVFLASAMLAGIALILFLIFFPQIENRANQT